MVTSQLSASMGHQQPSKCKAAHYAPLSIITLVHQTTPASGGPHPVALQVILLLSVRRSGSLDQVTSLQLCVREMFTPSVLGSEGIK